MVLSGDSRTRISPAANPPAANDLTLKPAAPLPFTKVVRPTILTLSKFV